VEGRWQSVGSGSSIPWQRAGASHFYQDKAVPGVISWGHLNGETECGVRSLISRYFKWGIQKLKSGNEKGGGCYASTTAFIEKGEGFI
jgi:hypothetical protein